MFSAIRAARIFVAHLAMPPGEVADAACGSPRCWLFRTPRGTFSITAEGRRWQARIDDVELGAYACPHRAAYAIANGETMGPYMGGLAKLKIPERLDGWQTAGRLQSPKTGRGLWHPAPLRSIAITIAFSVARGRLR